MAIVMSTVRRSRWIGRTRKSECSSTPAATFGCANCISSARPPPRIRTFGRFIVTRVPDSALKLVVGTLLLLFGIRWLHRAVLRSAGVAAKHDEERAYQQAVAQLQGEAEKTDWVGFILALKGVFLEGLEVVFIVIGVGGTGHGLPVAVAGGLAAAVVVAATRVVIRKPPARVPENTLKYGVGVILTSLGTFLAAGSMGASWPGDFVSIGGLVIIYFLASRLAITLIRRPALA